MSYENTECPCGGKKRKRTLICGDCETAFQGHGALLSFSDKEMPKDLRAHAAMILLTLARKRKANR